MPTGRYAVLGDQGAAVGSEEFRCAPGPAGWRYVSTISTTEPQSHGAVIDIVVDADWRPTRVYIDTGPHRILVEPAGDVLNGHRDGAPIDVPWSRAMHVDCYTPATNAVSARRLRGTGDIDVLYLAPTTLEPTVVRQRYERIAEEQVDTPAGRFAATRRRFTALDSGWTADLWVAGDVVVAYPPLFELRSYEPGASGARPLA